MCVCDDLERAAGVFYYAPEDKYEYTAAVSSREHAPFFGVWFCGGLRGAEEEEAAIAALRKRALRGGRGGGGGGGGGGDVHHDSEATEGSRQGGGSGQGVEGGGKGGVLLTLRALVEAGHVVSVEEECVELERKEALCDAACTYMHRESEIGRATCIEA